MKLVRDHGQHLPGMIMKRGKIFLVAAAALAILAAAGIIFVLTNLDAIVKAAIEKYGSQATKTDVTVSSVSIKLSSGAGSISGMAVENPTGFSNRDMFSLGEISVRIAVKSVGRSPLVIRNISISAPVVKYEMNSTGTSNLDILLKNLQSREDGSRKEPVEKGTEKETRIAIRRLVFENGRVEARIATLTDRPIMLDLPRLVLKDIGGDRGATPTEVARTVAEALARETAKVVARSQGEKYLKKGAERLLERYLGK